MFYKSKKRHSLRLPEYDYAQNGAYFVTICAWQKERLFGEIRDGVMELNGYGEIVRDEWLRTPTIRQEIQLDEFVIMPNHFHAIVMINKKPTVGAHGRAPLRDGHRQPQSLGSMVAGFKSICTKRINELRNNPGFPVWQRNYHERIIRNERSLNAIRQYILSNPANWGLDPENDS